MRMSPPARGAVFLLLAAAPVLANPHFVDVAAQAGLELLNVAGGPQKRFILEAHGNGAAFFDYDSDGDLDLYVANGATFEMYTAGTGPGNVLFRNEGDGAFREVTEESGTRGQGWGAGVAVGDFDNDGYQDLYATYYGPNRLYRNSGDSTFRQVSAGVEGNDFSASAAFFDYDRDGDLDLYVVNYVVFDIGPVLANPALEDPCMYLGGLRVFCGPQGMEGGPDRLYRNEGHGTFSEVTKESGVALANSYYGLGAVPEDFDSDGDLDLFVANDETPNVLFRNEGNGTFVDVAVAAGVAYNGEGEEEAGMGVDAGDYDEDGDADLHVTNFYGETNTLYRNEGDGTFLDATTLSGLAAPTVGFLGWGTRFFDFDADGDLDLFAANGHVYPQVDEASSGGT
jgi:hypothetical protein